MKNIASILEKLNTWNPWWAGQPFPLPKFHRAPFEDVWKALKNDKIQILAGPRQTGKTTVLRQLLSTLHSNGIAPRKTLYLPLDDFIDEFRDGNLTLHDLLKIYSENIDTTPLHESEKFFFLDEVHCVPQWARHIKTLVDRKIPSHFVISGSASAIVLKEAALSLAGRSQEYVMLPLSFAEVCQLNPASSHHEQTAKTGDAVAHFLSTLIQSPTSNIKNELSKTIFDAASISATLRVELVKYLRRGGFPEPALKEFSDEQADAHLQTILDQMIHKDFVDFFHVRDTKTLNRIIRIVAQNTGKILAERGLASDLGVAVNTIRNHLGFLEKTYIHFAARALSGSLTSQSRKSDKLLFVDPGLRNALVGFHHNDRGALLESAVFIHLWSFFKKHHPAVELLYWRQKNIEVDIVVKNGNNLTGIEVHISDNDVYGLRQFLSEKPNATGILVSDTDPSQIQDDRIAVIPPHLLMLAHRQKE